MSQRGQAGYQPLTRLVVLLLLIIGGLMLLVACGDEDSRTSEESAAVLEDHLDAMGELDQQADELSLVAFELAIMLSEADRLTGEYQRLLDQVLIDRPLETDSLDLATAWKALAELLRLRVETLEVAEADLRIIYAKELGETPEHGDSSDELLARLGELEEETERQLIILNDARRRYTGAASDGQADSR